MNSNHQGIMSSAIEYWSTRLCKNIVRLQYFSSPFYLSVIIDSFIMCSLQLHDVIIALWWWSVIGEKLPCCNCNCTKLGKNLYESLTRLLWDPWLTSFLHNSYLYNGGRNIGKSSTSFLMIYGQMVILAPNELLTLKYLKLCCWYSVWLVLCDVWRWCTTKIIELSRNLWVCRYLNIKTSLAIIVCLEEADFKSLRREAFSCHLG